MASEENNDFETGGDNASETTPIRAGEVKKGGFVLLKGKPCKVMTISTSKTGKHGHAKANMMGYDIFTGKKYEDISPTSHTMYAPVVHRSEWQFLNPDEDDVHCMLMNEDGVTREDVRMPPGNQEDRVREDIIDAFEKDEMDIMVTVLKAMGQEAIISFKLVDRKN
jgi:translation initiation factor 5A